MRAAIVLIIGTGMLAAQARDWTPVVRSIKVEVVPTSQEGPPDIAYEMIAAAWKDRQVKLAIERQLDADAVGKAKETIRQLYEENGARVRVEHRTSQIPPQGVEVAFQVIELCPSN